MRNDIKNPDPALRSRPLRDIVFAANLRYADGEWTGGSSSTRAKLKGHPA